jgi:hypothetical protein
MDLNPTGVYDIVMPATVISTARTIIQYNAPSTRIAVVLRAWLSQTLSETSTQEEVEILRTTTAGTGTGGPPTPRPKGAFAAAAGTATFNHSAEGTAGDSLIREGFNILNGWLWVATPDEYIILPPSARIALKFPVAPASATWTAGLTVAELG